jgi:hypothetical protein
MAGRDEIVERVRVALERIRLGRHAQHHMLVGLRGVGKTVLLDSLHRRALDQRCACIKIEAPEGRPLPELLVPQMRSALLRLDRGEAALAGAKRALGVLRNFASAFKLRYGELEASVAKAEAGVADSGDLTTDLGDLLVEVGLAARERNTVAVLFLDEIQYLVQADLGALVSALHHATQRDVPVALVGAGLPQLAGLLGEAKSYSERMFRFETIGPLGREDAAAALVRPARSENVEWEEGAVDAVIAVTQGYPYFLQEWGAQAWATADASPITRADVGRATPIAIAELDASFFRVRLDRLSPRERGYLRAMAGVGEGDARSAEIAAAMGRTIGSVAPLREALIRKGMIYSTGFGRIAFTVPLFGDFMRRAIVEDE